MVEYKLVLNVLRELIEEEIFETAKILNKKLTDEDIVKFTKMILAHIEERGLRKSIDNPVKLEEKVKTWK